MSEQYLTPERTAYFAQLKKERYQKIVVPYGAHMPTENVVAIKPFEASMSLLSEANQIANFIKTIVLWLVRGLIAPFEACLRGTFGERYFNMPVDVAFLGTLSALGFIFGITLQTQISMGFIYYLRKLIVLFRCQERDVIGYYWHSFYEGHSYLSFRGPNNFFLKQKSIFDFSKIVAEPLAVLIVAVVVSLFTSPSPIWKTPLLTYVEHTSPLVKYFGLVSVAMCGYQYYCWIYRKERLLDEKDAQVIGQVKQRAETSERQPGLQISGGVAVWAPPPVRDWTR